MAKATSAAHGFPCISPLIEQVPHFTTDSLISVTPSMKSVVSCPFSVPGTPILLTVCPCTSPRMCYATELP